MYDCVYICCTCSETIHATLSSLCAVRLSWLELPTMHTFRRSVRGKSDAGHCKIERNDNGATCRGTLKPVSEDASLRHADLS